MFTICQPFGLILGDLFAKRQRQFLPFVVGHSQHIIGEKLLHIVKVTIGDIGDQIEETGEDKFGRVHGRVKVADFALVNVEPDFAGSNVVIQPFQCLQVEVE